MVTYLANLLRAQVRGAAARALCRAAEAVRRDRSLPQHHHRLPLAPSLCLQVALAERLGTAQLPIM